MNENFIAKASIAINASRQTVWQALMSPDAIKEYMFGARVDSDWREGSPISWKGEWGQPRDKGTILQVRPERRLQYSHYSPLSGLPDAPVTIRSPSAGGERNRDRGHAAQDHNATEAEGRIQRRTGR